MNLAELPPLVLDVVTIGMIVYLFRAFRRGNGSETKTEQPPAPVPVDVDAALAPLKANLEEMSFRFDRLVEHVEEKMNHATKTWRKIQRARRESGDFDEEEDSDRGEFSPVDADGGNSQGLLSMSEALDENAILAQTRQALALGRSLMRGPQ